MELNEATIQEKARLLRGRGYRESAQLLEDAWSEIDRLREALIKYGDHREPCEYSSGFGGVGLECQCGWLQAKAAAEAPREGGGA